MENTQFNELLKSPHLLASMPIEELETLTKDYPWFSLAHSYLAKAYQENNSYKTSGQIALASTLHSNRTWLYGFLKEPILQKSQAIATTEILPTEIIPEIVTDVVPSAAASASSLEQLAESMMDEELEAREVKRGEEPEVREVKRGEELEVREVKKGEEEGIQEVREVKRGEEEGRQEVSQEVREGKKGEEERRQEVSQEVREGKKGEEEGRQEISDLDFLDKSILATAVSSSIFLEVSEHDTEQDVAQDSTKDAEQDVARDSTKDAEQDVAQDSTKDAEQEDALFTWLRSVSDSEEREVKKGEEEGRKSTESIQPTLNLIEKFIATEPRITPGKVEQYTGVSFAKDSLEENFDWVTETMAKLYAAQGKIDRARKAYKRLMELHPEKKIHFENQLKVLNQRK